MMTSKNLKFVDSPKTKIFKIWEQIPSNEKNHSLQIKGYDIAKYSFIMKSTLKWNPTLPFCWELSKTFVGDNTFEIPLKMFISLWRALK